MPKVAHADCLFADDCNGDGIPNVNDYCPGLANGPEDYNRGFQNYTCFADLINANVGASGPFLDNGLACIPVAARRIQTKVPKDILNPDINQSDVITGVVVVGVRASLDPDSLALLGPGGPATPQDVINGIKTGNIPQDALFGCIASFEFVGNALSAPPRVIYGHKVAASYVRAITTAMPEHGYKHDALGLFLDVRVNKMGWPDAIVGTHGSLWLDGLEVYDTKKAGSTAPGYNVLLKKDSSLPKPVTDLYDANCYARVEAERDKLFGGLDDMIKQGVSMFHPRDSEQGKHLMKSA